MNSNQLINMLGELDDSVLSEVVADKKNDDIRSAAFDTDSRISFLLLIRRASVVLAVCAVLTLIGGTFSAKAYGGGGMLRIIKDDSIYYTYVYTPADDVRIPVADIRGNARRSTAAMEERERMNQIPPALRSNMPGVSSASFNSAREAIDYIGYYGLSVPELKLNSSGISVSAMGNTQSMSEMTDGAIVSVNLQNGDYSDEKFELTGLTMNISYRYHNNPVMSCCTFVTLYTVNAGKAYTTLRGAFPAGLQYETERKRIGNREFDYLYIHDFGDSMGIKEDAINVFWQENKVLYQFHIVFNEETKAEAEQLAEEWMNGFSK